MSYHTIPYHTIPYHTKPYLPHLESHVCWGQVRIQYPDGAAEGRDRRPASAEAEREVIPLEPPRDALGGHHETRQGATTKNDEGGTTRQAGEDAIRNAQELQRCCFERSR